jgi:hypothetical protein
MSKSRTNIATASPNEHTRKQGTASAQKELLCVVTGQTKSGKSIIASHEAMKPLTVGMIPGVEFYRIWGSDTPVELPSDGTPPTQPQYFPPKNGFRFGMFSLPPATSTQAPTDKTQQASSQQAPTSAQLEEMEQKLPGLMKLLEADRPGMHTSDSVDFDVVVFGEVVLELDDGAEIVLKAGDCVIQNGTRHAWHNRSSQRCVVAFSLVGAQRERTT